MKRKIKIVLNKILSLFNVSIINSRDNIFDIDACLQRIKFHGFKFNSLIDIGAADGAWSMNFINHFPDVDVLAIEPLEERVPLLQKKAFNMPNQFYIANCIAGETDGEYNLLNVTNDLDGSTVDGNENGENRKVISRTIDSLVAEFKLGDGYIVKFDTHGFELPILNGMIKTLEKTEVIIMECYNFKITKNAILFYEMCRKLEDLGFRCFDISNPVLRPSDNSFWQIDIIFCRKNNKIFDSTSYSK